MYRCNGGRNDTGQDRGVLAELWKKNIWEYNSKAGGVGGVEWRP